MRSSSNRLGPALLLLLAPAAAARNCSTFWVPPPEGRRRLSSAAIHYTGTKTTPTLVVASNHKTGTFLSRCVVAVLQRFGQPVALGGGHVSGGFGRDAYLFQVNFARDPFVLVDSGYRYHRTGPEAWTRVALDGAPPGKQYQGEGAAFRAFAAAAGSPAAAAACASEALGAAPAEPPRRNETYADALGRFSLRDGLLFEALRSLHRDVPYVVRAAVDCGAQGVHCTTLLLDDIMADLPGAFRRIARAFRLADVDRLAAPLAAGAVERAFLDACGPESTFVASKKDGSATARDAGSHRNGPDAERANRLATLRDIDAVYLGGRLAAANATLRRHLR